MESAHCKAVFKRAGGWCEPVMEALCCSSGAEGKKAFLVIRTLPRKLRQCLGHYPLPRREVSVFFMQMQFEWYRGYVDITARLKEKFFGTSFFIFPKAKRKYIKKEEKQNAQRT